MITKTNSEIRLSDLSKQLVLEYCIAHDDSLTLNQKHKLLDTPIAYWKYLAKIVGPTSKKNYYCLQEVVAKVLEVNSILQFIKDYENSKLNYNYVVFSTKVTKSVHVEINGVRKKRKKCIGYSRKVGIIANNDIYYREKKNNKVKINRIRRSDKAVCMATVYESHDELVKEHPCFRDTKKNLDKILKQD